MMRKLLKQIIQIKMSLSLKKFSNSKDYLKDVSTNKNYRTSILKEGKRNPFICHKQQKER